MTSTEGMVRHAQASDKSTFIVATEIGILHRMRTVAPDKRFLAADPNAVCPFMKTITLESVRDSLVKRRHVVTVPPEIRDRASLALNRMVAVG